MIVVEVTIQLPAMFSLLQGLLTAQFILPNFLKIFSLSYRIYVQTQSQQIQYRFLHHWFLLQSRITQMEDNVLLMVLQGHPCKTWQNIAALKKATAGPITAHATTQKESSTIWTTTIEAPTLRPVFKYRSSCFFRSSPGNHAQLAQLTLGPVPRNNTR